MCFAVVPAIYVEARSPKLHKHLIGHLARALPAQVDDPCVGYLPALPPRSLIAQRQVNLLRVHEYVLVEAAATFECLAPDEQTSAKWMVYAKWCGVAALLPVPAVQSRKLDIAP